MTDDHGRTKPRKSSPHKMSFLRRARARVTERFSLSGREKEGGYKPRPITLPKIKFGDDDHGDN